MNDNNRELISSLLKFRVNALNNRMRDKRHVGATQGTKTRKAMLETLESREMLCVSAIEPDALAAYSFYQTSEQSETTLSAIDLSQIIAEAAQETPTLTEATTVGKTYAYFPSTTSLIDEALKADGQTPSKLTKDYVFNLNSSPTSKLTIYLDFNGHTYTGSAYNNGKTITMPAYNTSGTTSTFSNTELREIYEIWLRVAEDFAPFNVNVTTKEPTTAQLTKTSSTDTSYGVRVCVGGDYTYVGLKEKLGGVALNDSFADPTDVPVFIFPANLANDVKYIADAISHEVGHTLGLEHESTSSAEYYAGSNGWAPLMGESYKQELSQWSKGEFVGAKTSRDQIKILTSKLGAKTDAVPNTIGSAKAISFKTSGKIAEGLIETSADVDYYYFTYDGSATYLAVGGLKRVTNLDIKVSLYNSTKTLIATFDPTDTNYVTFDLAKYTGGVKGKYYISVEGTGRVSGTKTVYSAYGSLGYYQIRAVKTSDFSDSFGSNSTMATAYDLGTLVEPFTATNVVIAGKGKEDWFKIVAPAAGSSKSTVTITFDTNGGKYDLDLYFTNSEGLTAYASCGYSGTETVTLSGIRKNREYYIRVVNESKLDDVVMYTLTIVPPPVPKLDTPTLTAVPALDSIALNIGAVTYAKNYVVEYAANEDFTDAKSVTYTEAGAQTISGLNVGEKYYIRVKAVATNYIPSDWKTISATTVKRPLAAPTLSVVSATATALTVKIGTVEGAGTYVLEYSTSSSFTTSTTKSASYTTAGSKTLEGLKPGTTYYVRVKATGASNLDSEYASVQKKTALMTLDAPACSVQQLLDTSFSVSVDAVGNASSYVLESSTLADFSTKTTRSLTAAGVATIDSLTPATTYYCRVKAVGDQKAYTDSQYAAFEVKTLGNLDAPKLSIPSKTASSFKVKIVAVENASGYVLQYASKADFSDAKEKKFTTGITQTTSITNLAAAATYYVRVKATAAGYMDSEWATISAKTALLALDAPSIVPGAVTMTAIAFTITQVEGATGYAVEYATNSSYSNALTVSYPDAGAKTLTDLTAGTPYYIRVKALGDSKTTTNSAWAEMTAVTLTELNVPELVISTRTTTSIKIKIGEVENATAYVVEYSVNSDFSNVKTKTFQTFGAQNLTGLKSATTYYIRVKAVGDQAVYGESEWVRKNAKTNSPVVVTTPPLDIKSYESTSATLTINAVTGATSYVLEYSTCSGFEYVESIERSTPGDVLVNDLLPETKYYFRLKTIVGASSAVPTVAGTLDLTTKATELTAPLCAHNHYLKNGKDACFIQVFEELPENVDPAKVEYLWDLTDAQGMKLADFEVGENIYWFEPGFFEKYSAVDFTLRVVARVGECYSAPCETHIHYGESVPDFETDIESMLDGQVAILDVKVESAVPLAMWRVDWGDGASSLGYGATEKLDAYHFYSDNAQGQEFPISIAYKYVEAEDWLEPVALGTHHVGSVAKNVATNALFSVELVDEMFQDEDEKVYGI